MKHDTFALVRVSLLVVLILAFAGCCVIEAHPAATDPEPTTMATEPPTYIEPTEETEPPTIATEPPTEPSTAPTETEPTYTMEELEMLAIVIYREAGGDKYSDDTRLKVGTVVMNRIASKRYPNTMEKVLTQKSQYGRMHWTGVVWPKRASSPNEAHAVKRAYAIAERILQGERALPEDVIYQAEFKQGTKVVAHQDGLYFCR